MKMFSVALVCFVLSICGCSTQKARQIPLSDEKVGLKDENEFKFINYGLRPDNVDKLISTKPKLLFRFRAGSSKYRVYIYEFHKFKNAYCFLYKDGELVSIVPSETAVDVWKNVFGTTYSSLPNAMSASEIVEQLIANKINVKTYDFRALGRIDYKSEYMHSYRLANSKAESTDTTDISEGGVALLIESGIYYGFLYPPLFAISGASYLYMLGKEGVGGITKKKRLEAINEKEVEAIKERYQKYLGLLADINDIEIGTKVEVVEKIIGKADYAIQKSYKDNYSEKVMIYDPLFAVALGFNKGDLVWISYDYDRDLSYMFE